MAFLRNLLATILGISIFFGFGFLVLIVIVAVSSEETKPTVDDNTVLTFNLSGLVKERVVENPFSDFLMENTPNEIDLHETLKAIDHARSDARVKGLFLKPGFLGGGYSSLWEIRRALVEFKSSGKFIYAYGNNINEGAFYVSSVADKFFVEPEGLLEFNGLEVSTMFFKKALEKLNIKPVVFRVGDYKGAVEPFIREDLSLENSEQLGAIINDIYNRILSDMSASLAISQDKLEEISDNMLAFMPRDAQKLNLITAVQYQDSLKSIIDLKYDKPEMLSLNSYALTIDNDGHDLPEVAVVVADGQIMMGGEQAITPKEIERKLKKVREDDNVKAIVLRINSPGGDLTASDLIWNEVKKTAAVKPVIASMSDLAASGGYYMAAGCSKIVASPSTITGSIGIFGLWFNLEEFLNEKIGITFDVVKTGQHADIMSTTRELSDLEKELIQKRLESGYESFVDKVEENRSLTEKQVKKIAGGRVWTGSQALERKLVDEIGGIKEAIILAAQEASITDYQTQYYPEKPNIMDQIFNRVDEKIKALVMVKAPLQEYIEKLEGIQNYQGLQAILPLEFEF